MVVKIINGSQIEVIKDVYSIDLPGADGRLTVMVRHLPICATLKKGVADITFENKEKQNINILPGICLFQNDVMEIIFSEYVI
jgi:F0F1-type ATP synthase epsilon subunit